MLETLITNPVNLVLLVPLLYFIYLLLTPPVPPPGKSRPTSYGGDGYDWMPATHPECILLRSYTPKELSVFDGNTPGPDGTPGKILLAIERRERVKGEDGQWKFERKERTVFDVSAGRGFYGPGALVS
jgi:membrane-associated progesterone receptor component